MSEKTFETRMVKPRCPKSSNKKINMPVTPSSSASSRFAWFSAFTIFLSAFLLFQVQPIISRMILPWFGGGAAVWTTCLMFFQVVLLGGYAYAHLLSSAISPGRQMQIHIVFLIAAACILPIMPGEEWKPIDGAQPTFRILVLLLAKIGLPYFMLASTAPLLTAWLNRVYPGRLPFRLYALSNIGSLLALISYPLVFEPWFGIRCSDDNNSYRIAGKTGNQGGKGGHPIPVQTSTRMGRIANAVICGFARRDCSSLPGRGSNSVFLDTAVEFILALLHTLFWYGRLVSTPFFQFYVRLFFIVDLLSRALFRNQ
ncbi:MAG: hypothetical protein L6Q97_11060 [Thermoanaerobaculia bacterium]|nr:hypothetical protein [Thermoanaerobaculia bacterium]